MFNWRLLYLEKSILLDIIVLRQVRSLQEVQRLANLLQALSLSLSFSHVLPEIFFLPETLSRHLEKIEFSFVSSCFKPGNSMFLQRIELFLKHFAWKSLFNSSNKRLILYPASWSAIRAATWSNVAASNFAHDIFSKRKRALISLFLFCERAMTVVLSSLSATCQQRNSKTVVITEC